MGVARVPESAAGAATAPDCSPIRRPPQGAGSPERRARHPAPAGRQPVGRV